MRGGGKKTIRADLRKTKGKVEEKDMKKTVRYVGLATMVVLSVMLMTGCGKKVDLNECVKLKVEGVDTVGTARVEVDDDKLELMIAEVLGIDVPDDVDDLASFGAALSAMEKIEEARDCIEFIVEPSENLSNGDKVTVSAEIDEVTCEELGIKFKFKQIKEKVSGLKEANVISQKELFKDIVVEFTGVAPEASVQIRNTSKHEFISQLNFEVDKRSNLDKGDKIVVTASIPYEVSSDEYILKETSKEYKVKKVDTYVTSFDQISEEDVKKIMDQARDMVEAQMVTRKLEASLNKGTEYLGMLEYCDAINNIELQKSYFFTEKEGITGGRNHFHNDLDIVYKFDVAGMDKGLLFDEKHDYPECYIAISCADLIMTKEGKLQFDIESMEFTKGYTTLDSYYMYEVSTVKDTHEIQEVDLTKY